MSEWIVYADREPTIDECHTFGPNGEPPEVELSDGLGNVGRAVLRWDFVSGYALFVIIEWNLYRDMTHWRIASGG